MTTALVSRLTAKRQRGMFPLPWPDCDVHRIVTVKGPISTAQVQKATRLPFVMVENICRRLERHRLFSSRVYWLPVLNKCGRTVQDRSRRSRVWSVKAA